MEEKLGGPPPLEVSSMLLVLVLVKSASVVCRHLLRLGMGSVRFDRNI